MQNRNINYDFWGWPMALGVLLIIAGVAAIAVPHITTVASILLLGWLLVFGGVIEIVYAFVTRRRSDFTLQILLGILSTVVGVLVVFNPTITAITLTLLLAAFFLVNGIFRIITTAMIRMKNWGWFLFSGIMSALLGILILLQWPASSLWVIGLFIGIDFLFIGWSFVMLATTMRHVIPKHV